MSDSYYTGTKIRCPHCHRYFGAPDLASVHTYAAQGGIIQTLTERIIAQPIHNHYITPAPLWRAVAFALPVAFLAPSAVMYWNVDPAIAGGTAVVCLAVGLVIGSTQVEQTEMLDEPEDEPEAAQAEPMPKSVEQVTKPGPNAMSIRRVHEPPHDSDPDRQVRIARADLALAKLATASAYPMRPISWAEAQRRQWGNNGFRYGEKTFYTIQSHWKDEGLAFSATSGAVYLKPSGERILRQYVEANQ